MNFLAIDLGATSGRTILGSIVEGKLEQRELTRFPNPIIETGGHFYWDILALYHEIILSLKKVADEGIDIESIGIDTWGQWRTIFSRYPKRKCMKRRASSSCRSTPFSNSLPCTAITIRH